MLSLFVKSMNIEKIIKGGLTHVVSKQKYRRTDVGGFIQEVISFNLHIYRRIFNQLQT